MDTPAKTAMGGSLISALAVGGMVAVGVGVGVVADPAPPAAQAATGLSTFEDCDALQAWYVEHTIGQVGPYGWGGRIWATARESAPSVNDSSASSAKDGVSNGATGTNTQEAGIDEPDVAKTDGRTVVRLQEGQRLVITDVSGDSPRQVADWRVPQGSYVDGLLLVGDHVLLSGGRQLMPMGDTIDGSADKVSPVTDSGTEVLDVDISDPTRPVLDSRTTWSGSQLSLRQYGETVRMVTSTGLPSLPFVQPRPGRMSEGEAAQRNREIVRASTVEDWVPGITAESGSGTTSGPTSGTASRSLVGCDEVYHPKTWSGSDTVAVATFRPGGVDSASAVAVTGAGSEVYSSTDRLYVTSADWGDRPVTDLDSPRSDARSDTRSDTWSDTWSDSRMLPPMTAARTNLHAFALDGETTRYVASGSIDGLIRDRWSLDEYDGHLRVAVSWPNRTGSAKDNGVVVLTERDGRLEPVGKLRGLGVDEEIQSVRWFDDLAVIVTFRQMDPLYTIDLADPTHPRQLGALKIPGFSSYLHPIGGDRLLGIGTDATIQGQSLGAQAGVFDIGDPSHTRQLGKVTFGVDSWLGASEDPHAFTWLPDADAAITSLDSWNSQPWETQAPDQGTGMVLLRISPSGAVSSKGLPTPGGPQPRALPLEGGRVALVGSTVKIVDLDG